mmetsp:Transcript_2661/g.2533  ORF Transcript_2661/g.2533 Transcript_2661/m.2533 type:complete len:92 (-) Transcript_2661:21-296(-)
MRVYSKDVLYNQYDPPEEIFYIMKGRVKLHFDVNEGRSNLVNILFTIYSDGQYFGDSDCFTKEGKKGRDATSIADSECNLLVMNYKGTFLE